MGQGQLIALPLLVIWGVWLARNNLIFSEIACLPAIVAGNACGYIKAFPQHICSTRQQERLEVEVDRRVPWGYFDGAAQNNVCGGRAILHVSDNHFFELIVGLGEGSNNFAEIMSLKILLVFAAEKGCRAINFMGDSMNVINWIKGIQQCRILILDNVLRSTREILNTFENFSCQHIYRENNIEADVA